MASLAYNEFLVLFTSTSGSEIVGIDDIFEGEPKSQINTKFESKLTMPPYLISNRAAFPPVSSSESARGTLIQYPARDRCPQIWLYRLYQGKHHRQP